MTLLPRAVCISLAGVLLSTAIDAGAASDTATVTLKATVKTNTCSLEDRAPTVFLPVVSVGDFAAARGTRVGDKKVAIHLKDCDPGATQVKVTAKGISDSDDYSAFKNSADGDHAASGVGLYFYTADGIRRFYPDGSVSDSVPLSAGQNNTLVFSASYVSTRDSVAPGSFISVVNLEFEYQ
ncbi:fimbrial protein [Erwinia tasmaniensis]|uniref:Fimbrial subunit BcfE n=1 Tax=Erwinia tasmaniensis (strain DSM 17950 / CFBP 7177 / CIP 109463 / NCPPB 4357 / Et1/99) TaxID=465817 RepID=B2VJM1_ERWT9|nr:fimbrial protein [Erwinia tasmaniensis]CAO98350.1 Putative fimbrial subunit BcfE [Erwinia tasmaniensis Et1/99]